MKRGPEQSSDHRRHHRRVQSVFRWHAGQGGEGHPLRQYDDRADQTREGIRAQASLVHGGQPGCERQQSDKAKVFFDLHGVAGFVERAAACAAIMVDPRALDNEI